MATPRKSSLRGTRVPVGGSVTRKRESLPPAEPVSDPTTPRGLIDFSMQRRATLRSVFGGNVFDGLDICDADTYLVRAARYHGTPTGRVCPICRKTDLDEVTYAFGDELGHASGSAVDPDGLPQMAMRFGDFRVYVVEVCQECKWNHLLTSYTLGDGVPRRPQPRPRDLEDL